LAPGYFFKPSVFVRSPQPTSNADSLHFKTFVTDSKGDEISSFHFSDIILCSFDPNDKRVWPNRKGEANLTLNSEDLRYTIRFQNNGNDTAFAVKIVDVLDKAFDLRTLDIIDASHDVNPILHGDTVFFVFDPILLPDSTTNYIGSQGFVTYRIKLRPDVDINTKVKNTAEIIFDQNAPIITNTTQNTILEKLPCPADAIWRDNGSLVVNQESNEYSWFDCTTDLLVKVTDKPTFIPSKSGSYYCMIKGDYCNTKTNCISYIVSGSDDENVDEMTIYPNPTTGLLHISAPSAIDQVELIDLTGKLVFGAQYLDGQKNRTLHFEHLSSGQYSLKIVAGGQVLVKKVVIVK
jgi:hypothetical protein